MYIVSVAFTLEPASLQLTGYLLGSEHRKIWQS
jgi:hypothetical protein